MVRTRNDTVVLSSGRPDLRVWFSTDPRARIWQDIDILEHHNRWAPNASYRISQQGRRGGRGQTTSYTEIVEVSANRLLLVYDRAPFGWDPTPIDSGERSRVFVLPIEVQRD